MNLQDAVDGYLLFKATRVSPATIKTDSTIFRQLKRFLGADRDADDASADDIRAYLEHHRERGLSPHTILRHYVVIMADPHRAKALVLCLLDTGMRASEAARLTPSDVDFNTGRLRVMGKGSRERFAYLGHRARAALWLYVKDERPEPAKVQDNHLFLTHDGYPINRNVLRLLFRHLVLQPWLR
jgi:site-specific recombinase XerD